MNIDNWLALVAALLLLGLSPGPGWAAVVATAMGHGFRAAVAMSIGIAVGDVVFVLFAVFGLAAVAIEFSGFFYWLKLIGACYLIYAGVSLWRQKSTIGAGEPGSQKSNLAYFTGGLLLTLGNPKVIVFYLSFLPAFIDLRNFSVDTLTLVVLTVFTVISAVLIGHAVLALRAKSLVTQPATQQWFSRLVGTILIVVGIFIIVSND